MLWRHSSAILKDHSVVASSKETVLHSKLIWLWLEQNTCTCRHKLKIYQPTWLWENLTCCWILRALLFIARPSSLICCISNSGSNWGPVWSELDAWLYIGHSLSEKKEKTTSVRFLVLTTVRTQITKGLVGYGTVCLGEQVPTFLMTVCVNGVCSLEIYLPTKVNSVTPQQTITFGS